MDSFPGTVAEALAQQKTCMVQINQLEGKEGEIGLYKFSLFPSNQLLAPGVVTYCLLCDHMILAVLPLLETSDL